MNKNDHYYSKEPTSPFTLKKIKANLRSMELELYTSSGIFSITRIDKGTKVLIDYAIVNENSKILDLGCGYGSVGIVFAKAFPSCSIVMTDINERAVKLAKMNAQLNGVLNNTSIVSGHLFENVKEKFDTILLNPPQNAGREICFEMIIKSFDYLNKKGTLQLIARKNKGGIVLSNKMQERFGNFKVTAKKAGYWLYVSQKE